MKRSILMGLMACSSIIPPYIQAQSALSDNAQAYAGLDVYSRNGPDAFACSRNPAALAGTGQFMAGVLSERRFMLQEASLYKVAMVCPSGLGHFGADFSYAGFSLFHEQSFSVSYARKMGEKIQTGLRFKYDGYGIQGYKGTSNLSAELGILLFPGPAWAIGISAANLAGFTAGQQPVEKRPMVFTWGIGYDASDQFYTMLDIRKEMGREVMVTGSIQYRMQKQFMLKAGFQSGSGMGFAGAGLAMKRYRIDIAGSYHPWLGLSPVVSFQFFGKKQGHE